MIDNEFFSITDAGLEKFRHAYPGVEVESELRKAALWLAANPQKKKKNIARFLVNWLNKTHRRLLAVEVQEKVRLFRHRQEARVGEFRG